MSEEINEISKSLRKRYIKAATKDLARRHSVISKQRSGDRSNELGKKNVHKSGERAYYVAKAKETSPKHKKVVIKPAAVPKKDEAPKKPKVSMRNRIGSIVKNVFSKRKKEASVVKEQPKAKPEKVSNKGPIVRDMEKVVSALKSDAAKRTTDKPNNVVRLRKPATAPASPPPAAKKSTSSQGKASSKAPSKTAAAAAPKKPTISAKPLPKKK